MGCTHPIDARRIEIDNKEAPTGFVICAACGERWRSTSDPPTRSAYDRKCDEGKRLASRVAAHFGLELIGYGFPHEGASFIQTLPNGKQRQMKFDGDTIAMLFDYVESKS